MSARNNRILHIDGDSFFASCEIALDSKLEGRPVWVGGGRRGDGIVIAANRLAKKFGIKTGTACFEAKRLCPSGVLCKPHYDAYRELSRQMFKILEEYAPTLVPYSIDEGFLDFSTMDEHMWRNTTPTDYVQGIRQRIQKEVRLPVTAGLANSAKLAKLATDAAKGVGFLEVPAGQEKEFLKDRPVSEMSGIGKNRQRSLAAFMAFTFGDVARLPSMLLKQKFGIWGQQLWLFSNGQWNEPLVLEIKDRTTISSSTTLPQDEHDYEAALTFMLSESTRLTGQLRREQMQAREFSVAVRFTNFTEVGTSFRFKHPQFLNSVINEVAWIGVDLDGTLAHHDNWKGHEHIGDPIPAMVQRVKAWLDSGQTVKIFTARFCEHGQIIYQNNGQVVIDVVTPIENWCLKHLGQKLAVTNVKDYNMLELWDDRAVQVIPNTGEPVLPVNQ